MFVSSVLCPCGNFCVSCVLRVSRSCVLRVSRSCVLSQSLLFVVVSLSCRCFGLNTFHYFSSLRASSWWCSSLSSGEANYGDFFIPAIMFEFAASQNSSETLGGRIFFSMTVLMFINWKGKVSCLSACCVIPSTIKTYYPQRSNTILSHEKFFFWNNLFELVSN